MGAGENKYGGRGGLDGTNNYMSRLVRIIISIRRNDYTIINKKGADESAPFCECMAFKP
jgi:hypothetical protein